MTTRIVAGSTSSGPTPRSSRSAPCVRLDLLVAGGLVTGGPASVLSIEGSGRWRRSSRDDRHAGIMSLLCRIAHGRAGTEQRRYVLGGRVERFLCAFLAGERRRQLAHEDVGHLG